MINNYINDILQLSLASPFANWLFICLLIGYLLTSILLYFTFDVISWWPSKKLKFQRALLVVAHPDDECMFFGPTLINLLEARPTFVYALCLSAGKFEGKAGTRKSEFWNSCKLLGLNSSNIMLVNYEKMKDDPNREWPSSLIRDVVLSYVKSHDIDTVITFDKYGVSGHRNHCAIYETIKELVELNQWPRSCKIYILQSTGIIRKYVLSILDLWYSYLTSRVIYVVGPWRSPIVKAAMRCHISQLTWYRRLYIIFSRYFLINTLYELRNDETDFDSDIHSKSD